MGVQKSVGLQYASREDKNKYFYLFTLYGPVHLAYGVGPRLTKSRCRGHEGACLDGDARTFRQFSHEQRPALSIAQMPLNALIGDS